MSEFKINHDDCSFLASEIEHTVSVATFCLVQQSRCAKEFLLISQTKRRNWVYSSNCEPECLLPSENVSTKFNILNDE